MARRQWTFVANITAQTEPGTLQQGWITLPDGATAVDHLRDASRGSRICETCWDAMTDLVLPGDWTATGLDEACCAGCWPLPPDRAVSAVEAGLPILMHWNACAPPAPGARHRLVQGDSLC
jgi:hypothetical protein